MKRQGGGRTATSLSMTWKLNRYWTAHQLRLIINIDIILLILFCAGLFFVVEEQIAYVYKNMEIVPLEANEPMLDAEPWSPPGQPPAYSEFFSINITEAPETPKGITFRRDLYFLLPDETETGLRYFSASFPKEHGWRFLDASYYSITLPAGASYITIIYQTGFIFRIFRYLFTALLTWQFISWLIGIAAGAHNARRVLRPIADMASKADSLGIRETPARDPTALADMAGAIDRIDINRLNTRISVKDCPEELKELAGAINTMLKHIEDSYRQQSRFVSDASHELRTPIAVIQGYANLLDRWGKSDEKTLQESIDALKTESERMKILVESLLFLARGESESLALTLEHLNVTSLLEEIYHEYEMIDQLHQWVLVPAATSYINGDAALLKQAVRILADNALHYTPEGGRIEFMLSESGGFVTISVQDSGIGIPAADVPYIFDRFYRSDPSRSHRKNGSGLGLSIAKWIVGRHNGSWEVLSRKGIGTRITIKIPSIAGD